jgi:hypothetical protein
MRESNWSEKVMRERTPNPNPKQAFSSCGELQAFNK